MGLPNHKLRSGLMSCFLVESNLAVIRLYGAPCDVCVILSQALLNRIWFVVMLNFRKYMKYSKSWAFNRTYSPRAFLEHVKPSALGCGEHLSSLNKITGSKAHRNDARCCCFLT